MRYRLVLALAFALAARLLAGEEAPRPPVISIKAGDKEAGLPSLEADLAEFSLDGTMLIAVGRVKLTYGVTTVTCKRIVVWRGEEEAYVEGDVRVRRPDSELTADQAYINWANRQSFVVNFHGRSTYRGERMNWYVTAPSIAGISEGHYTARDVSLTTCSYAEPHHEFKADFVEIVNDVHLLSRGTRYYIHDTQVSPRFTMFKDLEYDWPWSRWDVGRSSEFGTFVRTDWRFRPWHYREPLDGPERGQRPDELLPDPFGLSGSSGHGMPHPLYDTDLYLNLDYLSKRGPAFGLDADYDLWPRGIDAHGKLDTYWVPNDQGKDDGDFDLGTTNRYRIKYFHQQLYPDGWSLDLEFNKYSDAGFQKEFFEKEFYQEKVPETRAYLKYSDTTWAWYLEGQWRTDPFRDTTEYLPRTGFQTFGQPLWGGVLWESSYELASVRRRFSNLSRRSFETPAEILERRLDYNAFEIDELGIPDTLTQRQELSEGERVWRFHTFNRLSRPFDVGIFNIEPWVGMYQTWYEETMGDLTAFPARHGEERSQWRGQGLAGVDVSTEFWREYDVQNETFELSGLRHIITPSLRYVTAPRPTVLPGRLLELDRIDEIDGLDRVSFGLRNQLQTHREGQVVNFIDLDLNLNMYPTAGRTTSPFDTVLTAPRRSREFSDLDVELQVRPWRDTRFFFTGQVDPNNVGRSPSGNWHTASVGVATKPSKRLEIFLGNRYEEGVASTTTIAVSAELTEKWSLIVKQEYDWSEQRSYDSELIFRRDMHAWVGELSFQNDRGESAQMVSLSFYPKGIRAPTRPAAFVRDTVEARDEGL